MMKLLKPAWVNHDGNPIFSIDIHPDGSRFATGGQGEDSGRVVIWNMGPVVNEDDEIDENCPRILCQLDNHLACVNCVRWSYNGKYLASGGDDKVIMIWQICKYPQGGGVFGSNIVNVEQWRCISTLRGHSGDILDLAWSPHDAWLGTCSVDNTVIIWNALKWPEQIASLKGHTGLVKGLAWDPIGKYVASQSDDKSLRIWRTLDWQQEKVIEEPFEESAGTTHVLRLNWSPDGQYLVSAHAMNNSAPTAQIVEREGWRTDKDFVGHRKAITCVRFNPNIFQKLNKNSSKVQNYCCCAIGSRDKSISVWLTALRRPLVIVNELFSNSILDLSWSHAGTQLMACSWDGTVAFIEFQNDEIGKTLTPKEKDDVHQKMYGKTLSMLNGHATHAATIIENPEFLKLQEDKLNDSNTSQSEPSFLKPKNSNALSKGPLDKQIETRTPDGKRRITPVYIPIAMENSDGPQPFKPGPKKLTFSSSTESKSKIVIEKRDEVLEPNTSNPCPDKKSPSDSNKVISSASENSMPIKEVANEIRSESVVSTPKPNEVKDVAPKPNLIAVKRKSESDAGATSKPPAKRGRPPASSKTTQQPIPSAVEKDSAKEKVDSEVPPPKSLLPALKAEKTLSYQILNPKSSHNSVIEVENHTYVSGGLTLNKVQYNESGARKWDVIFGSPVCSVCASSQICVIACEDSTANILNLSGRRLYPPIILNGVASKLCVRDWFVMCLSSKGDVNVWNFEADEKLVVKDNICFLLQDSNAMVSKAWLTESGSPVISLSNGKAYTFHINLKSWVLLFSCDNLVQQCSEQQPQTLASLGSIHTMPLLLLQAQAKRNSFPNIRLLSASPSIKQSSTVSHLDSLVSASLTLGSSAEYRLCLIALVRYLAQEGIENRLREVCDDLLGPLHQSIKCTWKSHILGLSKRKLLEEILPIISSNVRLQRLYSEYSEQLSVLTSDILP